ncbi:MAG: vanadium-dependent haloperoxidase [Gemmataceae bacterium]
MNRTPALSVMRLEARAVPAVIAVGSEIGSPTTAALVDPLTGVTRLSATPFGGFAGGASVACGDVTGDRVPDLIAAARTGGGPRVVVLDGVSGAEVRSFFAFDPAFTGGVAVACGDVNDDGVADIITAALAGGGPHVKVFDGATGKELLSFFAYDAGFTGGVSLAAADVTGDNRADIITGAGAGGAPHVKVFDGATGKEILSTFAYDRGFTVGVNVAAGDFDADGRSDVLTGAGIGGGPHVRCFRPDGTVMGEAMVGDPTSTSGVRVGCVPGGTTGDQLLAAVPGSSTVTVYDGVGGKAVATHALLPGGSILSVGDSLNANPVLAWNEVTLRAIRETAASPVHAARALGISSAAIFDASNSIYGTYQTYRLKVANTATDKAAAAAAAVTSAASRVLEYLFPARAAQYQAMRSAWLATNPGPAADVAEGDRVGEAVADDMIAWRKTDGSDKALPYTPGSDPGDYQLTPPAFKQPLGVQWPIVTPFAMISGNQFRQGPPPALTSAEYTAAYNEVLAKGGTTSTARTADETVYAHFWADLPGSSVTPPGHWFEIAARVTKMKHLSLPDTARMIGLLGLAVGDAAIVSWDMKNYYDFWRPVTAIRKGEVDGNPTTAGDPTWTPLWATPNFQSYTSGHSTFSGASAAILDAVFGTGVGFSTGTDDMPGVVRSFASFQQAAEEAGQSRIIGGIHFQFDNTAGLASGRALGVYVAANFMKPV